MTTSPDTESARLAELGYRQELRRSLDILGNIAIGFAVVSPVVGLYAVAMLGTFIAGPVWVWALPVVLVLQLLVVHVYGELAARWPLTGGPYQWSRRLLGPSYGWLTGWVWQFAVMFGNTTVAYLAAPWFFALFGITPSPGLHVAVAIGFVVLCTVINAYGIGILRAVVSLGIGAEIVASVLIGLALLLFFREHGFGLLTATLGAEVTSNGSVWLALLAVMAVCGWAFVGFDACVSTAEETRHASRKVPRAMFWALGSVGIVVILNAIAMSLAHPDPAAVVAGKDLDPVTTAVISAFGGWSAKPFTFVVLVSFAACLLASQGGAARGLYSLARDGVFPFAAQVRKVNKRQAPIGGLVTAMLVSSAALLLGLKQTAIWSLITFGSAAIFMPFFLVSLAALIARLHGGWAPYRRARAGLVINVLAVVWTALELINIWWPRPLIQPPGAPWYQVWAAPIGTLVVFAVGLAYLLARRPQDKLRELRRTDPPVEAPAASLAVEPS